MLVRPNAGDLLRAWERGLTENGVDRALTLLSVTGPDVRETLASLPVGERDARLLVVHEALFGPTLDSFVECPRCGTPLEFTVSTTQLADRPVVPQSAALEVSEGSLYARLRLPDSADLAVVQTCRDVVDARRLLCERCVVEASRDGGGVPASELTDAEIERVAAVVSAAAARSDPVISLRCAECQHPWEVVFDVAAFLWIEVNALAKRLLHQVHVLAWSYGWHEADILAMSEARRQFYLGLVQ